MSAAEISDASLSAHGAQAIAKGSKSFALASLLFGADLKADVHMLYAWCRHCDDVIDGQTLGGDAPDGAMTQSEQASRLQMLREQTHRALQHEKTGNPAFDGFSAVAQRRDLPEAYAMDLLDGFALDVEQRDYETIDELMEYCYGVAGVVGVMMAIIMGVDRDDHETLDRACDLGLAFQLTNICRDVVDDAQGGRIYLPLAWLRDEGIAPQPSSILNIANRDNLARVTKRVLDEAQRYYASASQGARRLPLRPAAAVLAARNVYSDIGQLVIARGAAAWDQRAVISTPRKAWLAGKGAAAALGQTMALRSKSLSPRDDLWQRPIRGVAGSRFPGRA